MRAVKTATVIFAVLVAIVGFASPTLPGVVGVPLVDPALIFSGNGNLSGLPSSGPSASGGGSDCAEVVTTGLVSCWKLDGNANDSIASNNGTATDVTYVSGRNGSQAASFNGATSKIAIANPANFRPAVVTLAAWINTPITGSYQFILGSWYEAGPNGTRLLIDPTGFPFASIGGGNAIANTSAITANTWQHVAFVYGEGDGFDGSFYLDGVQVKTIRISGGIPWSASTVVTIGSQEAFWFAGKLSEVRFYNRPLTPAEIQTLYNQT